MRADYWQYIDQVKSGRIKACKWVVLAVKRFEGFLAREDMEFRADEVEVVLRFIFLLKHFKNRHAGKPFTLEPWQQFIVAAVVGFYWINSERRVCQNVYIEMARKNGKTAFAAALALYFLIADGVAGAEVDLAANSKEQAKIAFEFASKFSRSLNTKRKTYVEAYRDRLIFDTTDSKMHVFAADASKLDGFGASVYLLDEYHAAVSSELRDVLKSSQADREDPLGIVITTAGFDKLGVCYKLRTMCTEILSGLIEDDTQFAIIYTLDDEDDWGDPGVWEKCSPNLGITVQPAFMETQVNQARNDPSQEVAIKTKTFNVWCDSSDVWIPEQYVLSSTHMERLEDYAETKADCFVGVDLSSTSDLTAVSYLVPTESGLRFWVDYYLPEDALQTKAQKETYRDWQRLGHLKITPGNVVDYDLILADILGWQRRGLFLWYVGYDTWNATQFAINATNAGLNMQPYSQSVGNFNRPTKEFERLLLGGMACIDNNPANRFCLRNVVIKSDLHGNQKPDKSKSLNKIDGVIAMLMALGVYLASDQFNGDISI